GVVAGAFEVLAVGLLGACAVRAPSPGTLPPERLAALLPAARRALAPVTVAVAVALADATANTTGSGPPATSATGTRPSGPGTRPAGPAGTAVVRVSIRDFAFVPARVVASPGEEVVVTNHDSVTHTFTATPGSRPFGRFDSGDISPGSTVTVRAPRSPGSYAFYCRIHPFMTGALVVR
ncbi:MAG: cupredoxin domain-containing protein, partial [Actinomycetota bacterium]|nr:cupredoxin domain-containing protein [Actinomycetota bacterium]